MEKGIALFTQLVVQLGDHFNRIPNKLLIFLLLSVLFFSPILNGNEEQYMQLAKQYMNPNWIFGSENLNEVPGTRILYQIIIGFLLKYLSFTATKVIFSVLLIFGTSIILGKIYRFLSIDNTQIFVHLVLFLCVFNQSFFAKSWMFISVEPKGFAYLFVLVAFYNLLKRNHLLGLLFLVVASYFHVLVGGYSFAYVMLTMFLFRQSNQIPLKKLFVGTIGYILLMVPFGIYLVNSSLAYDQSSQEIPASWIYTYFRVPHHTALFKTIGYFFSFHFEGILKCVMAFITALLIYHVIKDKKGISFIHQFVIVSFLGTLLFVPVYLY